MVRHPTEVVQFGSQPHVWRPCLRRSPVGERGVQGRTGQQTGPNERPGQGQVYSDQLKQRPSFFNQQPRDQLSQRSSFFLCNQPTNPPNSLSLSLYPEDGVVIYRSPWAGRGLGEADVTVRPDWTGPSWGPPFLGGVSARPGKPAHSTRV